MPTFMFRAENAKTDDPVKVHITLAGVSRGYTSEIKNKYLNVKLEQSGKYSWSAKRNGNQVASGDSSGGEVLIFV